VIRVKNGGRVITGGENGEKGSLAPGNFSMR